MGWATAANVLAMTGKVVTDQVVLEASAVIDIYANRTEDASAAMTARDLGWLQRACAFQAAWMPNQPGFHQRNAVAQITQDGLQIIYDKEWQISLAPLAARALKNLSWKTSRTVQVPAVTIPLGSAANFLNEASDEYSTWESFSIGTSGNSPLSSGC